MPYEITYPASVEFARKAFLGTAWRDSLGWRIGLLLVSFLSCVAVFAKFEPVFAGFGLGSSLAFAFCLFYTRSSYFGQAAQAARTVGTLHWRFDEETLHFRCDDREGTFQWRAVEKLSCLPEIWVLQFSGQPTPLPASLLSADLREFLVRKIREAGGKVRS